MLLLPPFKLALPCLPLQHTHTAMISPRDFHPGVGHVLQRLLEQLGGDDMGADDIEVGSSRTRREGDEAETINKIKILLLLNE